MMILPTRINTIVKDIIKIKFTESVNTSTSYS